MFKDYIAYLRNNPQGYWFKRKLYGWGWTPARPEGWISVVVYLVALTYFFLKADADSHSGSDTLIHFAVPFILLTTILIVTCRIKGEKPKWQWRIGKK